VTSTDAVLGTYNVGGGVDGAEVTTGALSVYRLYFL
jgi:hypothetical protein